MLLFFVRVKDHSCKNEDIGRGLSLINEMIFHLKNNFYEIQMPRQ